MDRSPEVADVIRVHFDDYRQARGGSLTSAETHVLKALAACRTAAMGGHVAECDRCGHRAYAYNSCCNRHCPKCQAAARADWLEARQADLLPVDYFHVVFTLPASLARVALQNKKVVYGLLFRASAETLTQIAADPKHLGAQIGFLSVLHTWGQKLDEHPHVHCVVAGGGLSPDGKQWISCPKNFFLPVKVLSRVFRGKFLDGLRRAYERGELELHGSLAELNAPDAFARLLSGLYAAEWVVYVKPPFGSAEQVLKYLARYTHRVAISNARLVSLVDGEVTFRFKNYARGNRWQQMTLSAVEFIRRFLLHVLPSGFVRIRHYGFLANRHRQAKLELARQLLAMQGFAERIAAEMPPDAAEPAEESEEPDEKARCPACGEGNLIIVQTLPRPTIRQLLQIPWPFDTS